jgi:hypothetical protein
MLSNVERIPLKTLEALKECSGKKIAFKRIPDKAPGMIEDEKDSGTVKDLSKEIFSGDAFIEEASELKTLKTIIAPDLALNQDELAIGYVHRKLNNSDIYFFANTSGENISFTPKFRNRKNGAIKLNPVTGNKSAHSGNVELAPFETVFIVTTDEKIDLKQKLFPEREKIDISNDWNVKFSSVGIDTEMKELISWTKIENLKNYSGEAVYTKIITLPKKSTDTKIILSLGDAVPVNPYKTIENQNNKGFIAFVDTPVKDAAIIFVNGKNVGTLFAAPYEIDISKFIKAGENLIEIKVYNRMTNKLAGEKLPDYSKLNEKYGQRFDCIQDFDVLEAFDSGLTGKIEIILES